jgi:hypothetical protein
VRAQKDTFVGFNFTNLSFEFVSKKKAEIDGKTHDDEEIEISENKTEKTSLSLLQPLLPFLPLSSNEDRTETNLRIGNEELSSNTGSKQLAHPFGFLKF